MEVRRVAKAMTSIANSRFLQVSALLLAGCGAAGAQAYTPPPPPLQFGPCVPTKEFPCDPPQNAPAKTGPVVSPATPDQGRPASGQPFPFPGEPTGTAAVPASAPAQKPADSSRFPFPGEPAHDSSPDAPVPATSSSSSSSGDPGASPASDPDNAGLKDAGSAGSTRFERKKLIVPEDLDKREAEDLDVSHYYLTTGNFIGAYARAQDAVKLNPEDEQAHFALGSAAEKMKKKDEAIQQYTLYLKMAPDGTKAKQVATAIDRLGRQ